MDTAKLMKFTKVLGDVTLTLDKLCELAWSGVPSYICPNVWRLLLVLIQDFNCALQQNFILQGHMYLFVHHICFYSNLFGFENKKVIPFDEVTLVKRAKSAGIFPTAIELIASEKKCLFTSFLSRDEAFKLINDGCMEHGYGSKVISDQQVCSFLHL